MSREERAVLDAARRWAEATEHDGDRASAETALLQAVRSWLGDDAIAKAVDEDYAEQAVERAVESTSAASTTDRAEAVEQLTGSGKRGGNG
jgi:hypothetical protein